MQEDLNEKHKFNQEERLKITGQITQEMNKMRERINALDLQSANNKTHVDSCRISVEHLETLVKKSQDRNEVFRGELDTLRRSKLEQKKFDRKTTRMEEEIKVIRIVLENTLNEFKAIENFTSK